MGENFWGHLRYILQPLEKIGILEMGGVQVGAARSLARELARGRDGSHDAAHSERVARLAVRLAREEQAGGRWGELAGGGARDLEGVELCALLHDVADHKYREGLQAREERLRGFLAGEAGLAGPEAAAVQAAIDGLGFKEELKATGGGGPGSSRPRHVSDLTAVVMDADRLDAIGAIGIARCFTFGGARNRTLHDPAIPPRTELSREEYCSEEAQARQTTLNHFSEKLLKLKGLMRSEAGRRAAAQRHAFMEQYLEQFHAEWAGER